MPYSNQSKHQHAPQSRPEKGVLLLHWKSWKWSVAEGRETAVDEHTPVPKVDDEYIPYLLLTDYNTSQNLKATFTVDIWQHFAETTFGDNEMVSVTLLTGTIAESVNRQIVIVIVF